MSVVARLQNCCDHGACTRHIALFIIGLIIISHYTSESPPRTGDVPLLVLLPGLDGTGKFFAEFAAKIAPHAGTRTIAYPVDIPLGYAELEVLVRNSLPRDRPFVLLGESFSGPVAIRVAAAPPPGLLGVVLCGTFAKDPFPLLRWLRPLVAHLPVKGLPRWLRTLIMWGPAQARRVPAQADRAIAAVASVVVRHRISALLTVDATAALQCITLPILVLFGKSDRIISRRATDWILQHAGNAEVAGVAGPHLLLQSKADECAVPVLQFMRRCANS
jgi:pimeloyl-ACP methyl ester carboxylesterase